MPIYEYECLSCGERFDAMQKFSDPPVTACRLCGGNVRKLLGAPALQFKGSGWYITDYAGKSPKPGPAGPQPEKHSGSGGPSTGTGENKASPSCACPASTSEKSK